VTAPSDRSPSLLLLAAASSELMIRAAAVPGAAKEVRHAFNVTACECGLVLSVLPLLPLCLLVLTILTPGPPEFQKTAAACAPPIGWFVI
jgi:hypothetical protein